MSVLKNKRGEQKLEVLMRAKDLMEYILIIAQNDKTFKPVYQALTTDIIQCAERVYTYLYTANEIYRNSSNLELRQSYQTKASAECNVLLALMDLSQRLNHFSSSRIQTVNRLISDVEENGIKKKGLKTLINSFYSVQRMDEYYLYLWKGAGAHEQRAIKFVTNLRASQKRRARRKN